ncbi:MAG: AEC family transporter [Deltaproteobacteria bacterium]|nr:MAG: AEC family transporter [Deltaproteobacteria bacterium]
MVLNSIFPVFSLIVLGYLLKKFNLINDIFLRTSDKLIYFIFFPALLFWKIGGFSSIAIYWLFCGTVLSAIIAIYFLSCITLKVFKVTDYQAGSFSQSCYRFNTYIGMAVIINALGDEGVKHFGILIGFAIPLINFLAVSTLIWFSGRDFNLGQRIRITVKALLSNPLILACIAGILYARFTGYFPVFIDNALRLSTFVTLPLALLSIGGSLTLKNFKEHFRLSLVASALKLVLLPVTGYLFMKEFNVPLMPFKVGMIFFTLPTSTAIYVLSSQLNSDTQLASASIVISTVLSFFSLSIILLMFS